MLDHSQPRPELPDLDEGEAASIRLGGGGDPLPHPGPALVLIDGALRAGRGPGSGAVDCRYSAGSRHGRARHLIRRLGRAVPNWHDKANFEDRSAVIHAVLCGAAERAALKTPQEPWREGLGYGAQANTGDGLTTPRLSQRCSPTTSSVPAFPRTTAGR